jgi:hypothetical protein
VPLFFGVNNAISEVNVSHVPKNSYFPQNACKKDFSFSLPQSLTKFFKKRETHSQQVFFAAIKFVTQTNFFFFSFFFFDSFFLKIREHRGTHDFLWEFLPHFFALIFLGMPPDRREASIRRAGFFGTLYVKNICWPEFYTDSYGSYEKCS